MEDALDDIQFLANSENRIRVLRSLADGTTSRRELQDETGVPRSSVARVLERAETRGWVDSTGSRYSLTRTGEVMIAEIRRTIAATRGIRHLGPAVEWLPDPVETLDFRHLRDARITTPTEANPTAAFDRGLELIRDASVYRGLTQNSLPEYMKVVTDLVGRGELDFEGVVEAAFLDVLREDPDRAEVWTPIVDRMWVYDGEVPINMHILDETVAIWLCAPDRDGADVLVKGLLETDDASVFAWAESIYAEYVDGAVPLTTQAFPTA
jgi:predicted transcriptional regulator